MREDQILHMVGRFLMWRLPESFNPDGGITFERVGNAGTAHAYERKPVGTNLLDFNQAEALVRHMVAGLPGAAISHASDCGSHNNLPCDCGMAATA